MRSIRGRLITILVVALIVIFGQIALGNTIAKNQDLIQPAITITEAFKNIPYNPHTVTDRENSDQDKLEKEIQTDQNRVPPNPNITQEQNINEFAWKDFVALNWPSNCVGKPLENQLIGQAPDAPRVWELYPSPKDVFKENGAEPTPLTELPEVKNCLGNGSGLEIEYRQSLRLTETGELVGREEFGEVKTANQGDLLDGYGELKPGISLANIDAANHIPLVDRQGNYVINEIRLNPVEYNQVLNNTWYDASHLLQLINSNKQFKLMCSDGRKTPKNQKYCGDNNYEAEGAIEIKAVWRVFDGRNTEQEKARYYTTKRKIVSKEGEILKEQAELGLIGFHIMHKTSQLSWVWSTFEHIDNAPPCGNHETTQYTLYNNECKTGNCKENWPYVKKPYLWNISNEKPKAVTLEGIAVKDQIPSQICRANLIRESATKQNKEWQESLRSITDSSVWQYYQLIGTQWLQNPQLPYSNIEARRREIKPESPPLTNAALEPYAQKVSCIVCHTSARLLVKGNFCQLNGDPRNCADFSFLMDNAQLREQIPVKPN